MLAPTNLATCCCSWPGASTLLAVVALGLTARTIEGINTSTAVSFVSRPARQAMPQEVREAVATTAVVGVYVITSGLPEYKERVRRARATWACCWPVSFFAATADTDLGVEALAPCADDEGHGVCCKMVLGLRKTLERFPRARWIVRAVDDSFIFVDHLAQELRVFNAAELVYVGVPSITTLCRVAKFSGQCGELHAAGGAGIVFSRPLAEIIVHHEATFLRGCQHDDLFLGHFLRYTLGVHVQALPGALQEPRFARALWRPGQPMPQCPQPLPPPVYARLADWGPLQPFAPLDATRLVLVHSDPHVWPQLQAGGAWWNRIMRIQLSLASARISQGSC